MLPTRQHLRCRASEERIREWEAITRARTTNTFTKTRAGYVSRSRAGGGRGWRGEDAITGRRRGRGGADLGARRRGAG